MEVRDMTEAMGQQPPLAPKLHGRFVLSRLAGAGVVVQAEPDLEPGTASLSIGDAATHVVLVGTPAELVEIAYEAYRQATELRDGGGGHG
jgi:hypothetical protein